MAWRAGGMPAPARDSFPLAALEWHLRDGGDPAAVLASFLGRWGLGPPFRPRSITESERLTGPRDAVRGAVVLLSAAAAAAIAGAPPGRPSPAPLVPDVVAVVFGRLGGGGGPGRQFRGSRSTDQSSDGSESADALSGDPLSGSDPLSGRTPSCAFLP